MCTCVCCVIAHRPQVQARLQGVQQISATGGAFAAVLEQGVVVWGQQDAGGDISAVQSQLGGWGFGEMTRSQTREPPFWVVLMGGKPTVTSHRYLSDAGFPFRLLFGGEGAKRHSALVWGAEAWAAEDRSAKLSRRFVPLPPC